MNTTRIVDFGRLLLPSTLVSLLIVYQVASFLVELLQASSCREASLFSDIAFLAIPSAVEPLAVSQVKYLTDIQTFFEE